VEAATKLAPALQTSGVPAGTKGRQQCRKRSKTLTRQYGSFAGWPPCPHDNAQPARSPQGWHRPQLAPLATPLCANHCRPRTTMVHRWGAGCSGADHECIPLLRAATGRLSQRAATHPAPAGWECPVHQDTAAALRRGL
jgi:hypothetical protein